MHHAHIDKFAYQDSPVHRLDSRSKLLVTIAFTALVLSLPKTSLSILACYAVGPFTILVIGKIPLRFALRQICIVSPFVLVLALSCPFYDRTPASAAFGPFVWSVSVGWLRCFTIIGKFVVTMLALIALISTTRFSNLLSGMQKLGLPKLLVVQLGFLYRYIFVLIDRAHHILLARAGRKLRNLGFKRELKTASAMLGSLFVRSIDTAQNINIAMQARGFDGSFHTISKLKFKSVDGFFVLCSAMFMILMYFGAGKYL